MTLAKPWVALASLAFAASAHGGEFVYQAPVDWSELPGESRPGNADTSRVPPHVLQESMQPRYEAYAIDPKGTTREKVGATFNAVETPTTRHMTADDAKAAAEGVVSRIKSEGFEAKVLNHQVITMNGVPTAVFTVDMETEDGARRMRQYIIPGHSTSAVLSYSAPKADFEKYVPAFTASARATQGGFDVGERRDGDRHGGGGEFQYKIPEGWRDFRAAMAHGGNAKDVPSSVFLDAFNAGNAVVAYDPKDNGPQRLGAIFTAIERPTTGKMSEKTAREAGEVIVEKRSNAGFQAALVDTTLRAVNGVDTVVVTIDVRTVYGPRRERYYLIPGTDSSTMLAYGAPKDEFEKYEPIFEDSARATKGADPEASRQRTFNVREFFLVGLIAGVLGAVLGLAYHMLKKSFGKKRDEAHDEPAAAKAPAKRATKYTWYCESCGNPVPIRIDQCRCGGKKPG